MEALLQADLSSVRTPRGGDRVYKVECVYSFHTTEGEGGLYVSLSSFLAVAPDYLSLHYEKSKDPIFLHITRTKKPPAPKQQLPLTDNEGDVPPAKKPTRLALGVEGGFDGGKEEEEEEWDEMHEVVVMPSMATVALPNSQLPQKVSEAIGGILSVTATKVEALTSWDGEKRCISKHAMSLKQLDNGVKVRPSGWKCSKCDLTTNLWMNLTDGTILCGRLYWDGSGGNNHALDQYASTKYPLAVKLGTITPSGADVFSYEEDNMVVDPLLSQHLEHFGINITSMIKTDATMTELEIEANMKIGEGSIIQEAGKKLKPCFGAGYTGLINLGSTCYINSVMQVLFSLPEFQERYYSNAVEVFRKGSTSAPNDFAIQMSKLAVGLLSGQYSQPKEEEERMEVEVEGGKEEEKGEKKKKVKGQKGINMGMFRSLVVKDHSEFSSNRQQDAPEFFLHLLSVIERSERAGSSHTPSLLCLFQYEVEERIECVESGQVRYTTRGDSILQLPVAIESASNKREYDEWQTKKAELQAKKERVKPEDEVRAKVPFSSCLLQLAAPVALTDFYSTALHTKSPATKITRFSTFPDYLVLMVNKYFLGDDWTPKKYDVEINMPETLDLTYLRGNGLQPGEIKLPEEDNPANEGTSAAPPIQLDEGILTELVTMGFNIEGCRRALYHTQSLGIEPALNWVLQHMGDPDFSSPFSLPQHSSEPTVESIDMVTALGFTRDLAVRALKATDNSIERAADWLFSRIGSLDDEPTPQEGKKAYHDGSGKYQLHAFISHIGPSTACGHYVCHIHKDGRWVIYNDEKVAESAEPPISHAYLYFYRRLKQ